MKYFEGPDGFQQLRFNHGAAVPVQKPVPVPIGFQIEFHGNAGTGFAVETLQLWSERMLATGAIDEEGMTHPERCLRNYMMEGIVIPDEIRTKMGMRLIGCDICQRACPMQDVDTRPESTQFQLSDFVTNDSQAFSRSIALLAQEIGRNIARPQRVRAQAAILAGKQGTGVHLLAEGGEIAASVCESDAFFYLDAPVRRLASEDVPVPFSAILEKSILPDTEKIVACVREMTG